MSEPLKSYATDEDVVLRSPMDFASTLPFGQTLASGIDGEFQAGSRWTLRSAKVNFGAQGVRAGQVVRIRPLVGSSTYSGELYVVATVLGSMIEIRRPGQSPGMGQPPSPVEGLQGAEFLVTDLSPSLEGASYEVASRLGQVARDGTLLPPGVDRAVLRDLTVVVVLRTLYDNASTGLDAPADSFASRAARYRMDFEDRLTRLSTSVDDGGASLGRNITRYKTRLSR